VLCERHNNALSPLDTYAGAALAALANGMDHATKMSLTERTGYFLGSGDALERWSIKVLLGTYFGRIATSDGEAIKTGHSLDLERWAALMFGEIIPSPLGLYAESHLGAVAKRDFGFAALTEPNRRVVAGLQMMTRGLSADFMLSDIGGLPHNKTYRPFMCEYNGPKRSARVVLTWRTAQAPPKKVSMRLVPERR
jgi:hypothetical protein